MGLASRDDDGSVLRGMIQHPERPRGIERHLRQHRAGRAQRLDRAAEPGRVLLREDAGHLELCRRIEEAAGIPDRRVRPLDHGHQPGLEVDHEKGRGTCIEDRHHFAPAVRRTTRSPT